MADASKIADILRKMVSGDRVLLPAGEVVLTLDPHARAAAWYGLLAFLVTIGGETRSYPCRPNVADGGVDNAAEALAYRQHTKAGRHV